MKNKSAREGSGSERRTEQGQGQGQTVEKSVCVHYSSWSLVSEGRAFLRSDPVHRRWRGEAAVEGWHGQAANSGDGTS